MSLTEEIIGLGVVCLAGAALIGFVILLYLFFWVLGLGIYIAISAAFLWLLDIVGVLPFDWLHAIILGFGLMILRSIFSWSSSSSK